MIQQLNPNADYEIVWQPVPGTSQEYAITSPAHHTLYYGARGPGKTITQLMRYRSRVGVGYGSYWRGVIFDREFKHLEDLKTQGNRFFPQFDDGVEWKKSAQDYKWVWPTGEELLLRHVKNLEDYLAFHGHEYCLAVGEKIKLRQGDTEIEKVKVGDEVLTPKGFRRITRVFPRRVRPCVTTSFFDKDLRLISEQVTSTNHRMLTNDGVFEKPLVRSFQIVLLLSEAIDQMPRGRKFSACVDPTNEVGSSLLQYEEIFSKGFDTSNQNVSKAVLRSWLRQVFEFLFHQYAEYPRVTNLLNELCKFSERFVRRKVTNLLLQKDCLRLFEQVQQVQNRLLLNLNVLNQDVLGAWHKVLDLIFYCYPELCLCDGLAHMDKGISRSSVPLRLDAPSTNHPKTLDDSATKLLRTHLQNVFFLHPYTGKQYQSDLELSESLAWSEPCGNRETIDIEVEGVNCYISSSGVCQSNSFLGWNELTKWPTLELYDLFMSVNRSAFQPETHTPHNVQQGKKVYLTHDGKPLPPIPLEVFSTTNSSGPGRNGVKKRFIDVAEPGEIVRREISYYDERLKEDVTVERTQVAIFGSFFENPFLDPVYRAGLIESCEADPNKYASWIKGSWDVSEGGALDDLWRSDVHVISRRPIPAGWKLDRSFDWGSTHPFACLWWAEANGETMQWWDGPKYREWTPKRGSLIAIQEYYGKGIKANSGLKMSAKDIAVNIKKFEEALESENWIYKRILAGPADNQIRDVREVDVETIEQKMAKEGILWTKSDKSAGSRKIGLQLMRDRLQSAATREGPGIYFMNNCVNSIETLSVLPRDPDDLDDVDTMSEDHIWDAVRYRVLRGTNQYVTKLKSTWNR